MAFDGTAEYSLDAKNRLTVPARFRADFSAGLVLYAAWPPLLAHAKVSAPPSRAAATACEDVMWRVRGTLAVNGCSPVSF